jgi:hypothetical protein
VKNKGVAETIIFILYLTFLIALTLELDLNPNLMFSLLNPNSVILRVNFVAMISYVVLMYTTRFSSSQRIICFILIFTFLTLYTIYIHPHIYVVIDL